MLWLWVPKTFCSDFRPFIDLNLWMDESRLKDLFKTLETEDTYNTNRNALKNKCLHIPHKKYRQIGCFSKVDLHNPKSHSCLASFWCILFSLINMWRYWSEMSCKCCWLQSVFQLEGTHILETFLPFFLSGYKWRAFYVCVLLWWPVILCMRGLKDPRW